MKHLARIQGRISVWLVAGATGLSFTSASVRAQPIYTLTNGNSSAQINTTSQAGMFNWLVDGQNQLNQQWFWFRNGNGVPQSIDTLALGPVVQPSANMLVTTYSSALFSIQLTYSLIGGALGSGTADISEQIKIQNLTGSALTATHFYQYADFIVPGILELDTLHGLYADALLDAWPEAIEAAALTGANRGEVAQFNQTLNELNNTPGLLLNNVSSNGPGHTTWALEWDPSAAALPAGGAFSISNYVYIDGAPEPSPWLLLSMGVLTFGFLKFRRIRAG